MEILRQIDPPRLDSSSWGTLEALDERVGVAEFLLAVGESGSPEGGLPLAHLVGGQMYLPLLSM